MCERQRPSAQLPAGAVALLHSCAARSRAPPASLARPHPLPQASKEEAAAAAAQVKGAVMPITKEAPKLETVKISGDMKVRAAGAQA